VACKPATPSQVYGAGPVRPATGPCPVPAPPSGRARAPPPARWWAARPPRPAAAWECKNKTLSWRQGSPTPACPARAWSCGSLTRPAALFHDGHAAARGRGVYGTRTASLRACGFGDRSGYAREGPPGWCSGSTRKPAAARCSTRKKRSLTIVPVGPGSSRRRAVSRWASWPRWTVGLAVRARSVCGEFIFTSGLV
jgi:hypothetical protein